MDEKQIKGHTFEYVYFDDQMGTMPDWSRWQWKKLAIRMWISNFSWKHWRNGFSPMYRMQGKLPADFFER